MELYHLAEGFPVMRRFLIDKGIIAAGEAIVSGDLHRHMMKVLRLKPGTSVLLLDGEGGEYEGVIKSVGPKNLLIGIERQAINREVGGWPAITLYQGMPKGDKLEYILQKCTELGVAEIVPFAAARSIVKVTAQRSADRVERWQKIAAEASRQSQRAITTRVSLAAGLSEVLQQAHHSVKLLLWEEEQVNRLKSTLSGLEFPESIAVLVGPEGGFSPEEAAMASAAGFIPVSLGKRIMRTETAGIVIVSILQFYWGDVG